MYARYFVCAVCVAAFSATLQAQVRLRQTPPEQTTQQFSVNRKTQQTLTINGNDITSSTEDHALLEATYGKRGEDGLLPIKHHYKAWQADLDVNGDKLHFDSANPEEGATDSPLAVLLDGYRKTTARPFTLVVDNDQRVKEFRGWDNILEGLDDASAKLHRDLFDQDYQRSVWDAEFQRLPTDAVEPGDTWVRESQMRLLGGYNLQFTKEYKYVGPIERGGRTYERVEVATTKVNLQLAADDESPLVVADSKLDVAESSGELLFDPERGQISLVKDKVRVKGDLTFKVTADESELPGKVDFTIESDSTLLP